MAESKTQSISPTLYPRSPYSLHLPYYKPSDFSVTILSEEEDNYVIWKRRFLFFLRMTEKIGFVDGTIEKPDRSSPLYKPWDQCDALVTIWLMDSMSEKLQDSVLLAETAHEIWEGLRRIFVPNVDLKIYHVRQRIAMLRQGGASVNDYFVEVCGVWMELSEYDPVPECACGGCKCECTNQANEAREKEKLYAFLMGLNKCLSPVAEQIMVKNPLPSAYDAHLMVEKAESRMKWARHRR